MSGNRIGSVIEQVARSENRLIKARPEATIVEAQALRDSIHS